MKKSLDQLLSAEAQELVHVGRSTAGLRGPGEPTQADLERNLSAIAERIAEGQLPDASAVSEPAATAPSAAGHAGSSWGWIVAASLGVGVLGGLFLLSSDPASHPSALNQEQPSETPVQPPQSQTPSFDRAPEAPDPAPPSEPPTKAAVLRAQEHLPPLASAVVPQRSAAVPESQPADELAQEVALLSAATSALRAGRAQETLNLLHQHQTRFPQGTLAQERRSAQAQALCLLGNRPAAEAVLRTLSPTSPFAARAKRACNLE